MTVHQSSYGLMQVSCDSSGGIERMLELTLAGDIKVIRDRERDRVGLGTGIGRYLIVVDAIHLSVASQLRNYRPSEHCEVALSRLTLLIG